MVHAYHVIFGTYGFWLPNDPRGSWSDFVASWELARFGKTTKSPDRRMAKISEWARWRAEAEAALKFPTVVLTGRQAQEVGNGFANGVRKGQYSIWACSILPQHVHMVIGRHSYKVEQIVNLLKGEATKQLKEQLLHPHRQSAGSDGKLPSMWAERQWKVFFDNEEEIEGAIRYVEENPEKEGKPRQNWSFVTAFAGIDKGGWATYL